MPWAGSNIFIIYLALPALFFKLVSKTPIEQLTRFDFVLASIGATYTVFALIFSAGYLIRRNSLAESTVQGLAGAYGNIGYMGPGLALAGARRAGSSAGGADLLLRECAAFHRRARDDGAGRRREKPPGGWRFGIARKILLHPFILSTIAGVIAALLRRSSRRCRSRRLIDYLAQAAAPCALFAMGVTLALRPLKRIPAEIGYIVPAKLILHPVLMYLVTELRRQFRAGLGADGRAAGGAANGDQRLRHRPAIWRLAGAGIGDDPDHHRSFGGDGDGAALPDQLRRSSGRSFPVRCCASDCRALPGLHPFAHHQIAQRCHGSPAPAVRLRAASAPAGSRTAANG